MLSMQIDELQGVRIARVSTVPFFVATQLRHQLSFIAGQGAKVSVVTSNGPELSSLGEYNKITCVPIEIPRAISPWKDLVALFRLYMFFKRERIDIAHSTTPKAGLLTAVAAYFAGVPIRLHTFTGQPWVNLEKRKALLLRSIDRLIGRLNTVCYADSFSQRQFLIDQKILKARKLMVLGGGSLAGVNLQRFDPKRFSSRHRDALRERLGIPSNVGVLLFVGRMHADKGIRELLQAFSRMKAQGMRTHLVLIGPLDVGSGMGGSLTREELTSLADTHFVGYSNAPEDYMAIADVLCLPSYREGFGTVIIEAAAMGVPAVGSDIYGLSDAVVDGQTGLLVPPRNPVELQKALERLICDQDLRKQMGVAARQRVELKFDANLVSAAITNEYKRLLKK